MTRKVLMGVESKEAGCALKIGQRLNEKRMRPVTHALYKTSLLKATFWSVWLLASCSVNSTQSSLIQEGVPAKNHLNCKISKQLFKEVETSRGLRFLKEPRCRQVSVPEMQQKLLAEYEDEARLQLVGRREALFLRIGLLPTGFDYVTYHSRSLGPTFLGAYSPEAKELLLSSTKEVPPRLKRHELVHALQDQHFDLERILAKNKTFDEELSMRALIEGDAEYIARRPPCLTSEEQLPALESLFSSGHGPQPRALALLEAFPYVVGVNYACRVYQEKGSEGLNALLRRGIIQSQEMMFGNPAIEIPGNAVDSIGAYGVFALLSIYYPMSENWHLVRQWRGDWFDGHATWVTQWSDESSAEIFFERVRQASEIRFQGDAERLGHELFFRSASLGQLKVSRQNVLVTFSFAKSEGVRTK